MAEVQQIREVPAKLAYFQPEIVQDTVETSYIEEHHPIGFNPDNINDPIKFYIRGSEHWIDFEKSYFDISGTIIGDNGANANATDAIRTAHLTIANNFLHSLFSSIHVNVNDSAVTFSNEHYPYIAYIQNLINYPEDFQNSHGDLFLWKKDTSTSMNGYAQNHNRGGYYRKTTWIQGENKIRGIMRLRSPLFLMRPYLLSFLNVDITMNRISNQDFLFIADAAATFKFKIDSIILRVRKVKLVTEFVESIEHMLTKVGERINYPLRDSRVFTKTYSGYGTELIEDNLFHGILPDRIVLGIVANNGFSGNKAENPFHFRNKGISEIGIYVNGMPHPINPMSLDFTNHDYHVAYYNMMESFQAANPGNGNAISITKEEFRDGYTLFSFDMSSDQYGGLNHYSLYNTPANVQLRIKFKQSDATDIITLIIYYEISTRMVVDQSRRVQIFSK